MKGLPYAAIFHEQGLGKTKIGVDLALEWLKSNEVGLDPDRYEKGTNRKLVGRNTGAYLP